MLGGKRLSDVVVPGRDYAAKVKIEEVLDHDVLIKSFETAVDPESGRVYWNITVDDNDVIKTFSTGAIPISKVLSVLAVKVENGEAELPLVALFRKEGRTYVIE